MNQDDNDATFLIWNDRVAISVALRFIACHVGMIFIVVRVIVAEFTHWESYEYNNSQFRKMFGTKMILATVSFSLHSIVCFIFGLVYKRKYGQGLFTAFVSMIK